MRPIGFSTGALAGADFRRALQMLKDEPGDSVELSALRYAELKPLLSSLESLNLGKYKYVSVHAPSSFTADQEVEVVELLRKYVPPAWPIVLHPDTVDNFDLWRSFGRQLAIENMDKRKPIGRTAEELSRIFEKLPRAGLCFDLGHARQCDTTMTEAYRILKLFADRLLQVHVSEVNTSSRHDPLSFSSIMAFGEVSGLIPESVPVLLESRIASDQIGAEMEKAQRALPLQSLMPA